MAIALAYGLLIAPEGIEITEQNIRYKQRFRLLIAPEGIEIKITGREIGSADLLLIAPEGIEIIECQLHILLNPPS